MRDHDLRPRMYIDEIERAWPRISQDPEIVADREHRIEGSKCVTLRVVSTRDIALDADSWVQWKVRKGISGIGREGPGANIVGAKTSELHDSFIVEIERWVFLRSSSR